jgi:hypothetical protein
VIVTFRKGLLFVRGLGEGVGYLEYSVLPGVLNSFPACLKNCFHLSFNTSQFFYTDILIQSQFFINPHAGGPEEAASRSIESLIVKTQLKEKFCHGSPAGHLQNTDETDKKINNNFWRQHAAAPVCTALGFLQSRSYGCFTPPTQYFPVPSGIFVLPTGVFPVPSGVFVLPAGIFSVPSDVFVLPSGL